MLTREKALEATGDGTLDAVVVGSGVSGAATFRELGRRGYRVLLVDRGDFAAGTSQASGMLIWGGLMYLRNLDLATAWKLSTARDAMLLEEPDGVARLPFLRERRLDSKRSGFEHRRWLQRNLARSQKCAHRQYCRSQSRLTRVHDSVPMGRARGRAHARLTS